MKPLEITADFECANAEEIRREGDRSFSLSTRPDRAVDCEQYEFADYYVAFRLINPNPQPVEAEVVYRELNYPETGRTLAVRDLFENELLVEDWRPLPREEVEIDAVKNSCRMRVTVQAEASLDVSSMYWMSGSQVYERLGQVEGEKGVRVSSLGQTAQSREIPLIELESRRKNAPLCALGATPQCHELGTIAIMGIFEAALKGKLEGVLERCSLALLPLSNPDGNALGSCMTNALRQNVIFGFGAAGSGEGAVECERVWDYLSRTRPLFFLEFHSYPHLNRPSFRPYDVDRALFPDDESRRRGETFFAAVNKVAPNPGVRLEAGSAIEKQFRPSLISRLIADLGVPATLYKLHNRETVADNVDHSLQVLEGVATAMCR